MEEGSEEEGVSDGSLAVDSGGVLTSDGEESPHGQPSTLNLAVK